MNWLMTPDAREQALQAIADQLPDLGATAHAGALHVQGLTLTLYADRAVVKLGYSKRRQFTNLDPVHLAAALRRIVAEQAADTAARLVQSHAWRDQHAR